MPKTKIYKIGGGGLKRHSNGRGVDLIPSASPKNVSSGKIWRVLSLEKKIEEKKRKTFAHPTYKLGILVEELKRSKTFFFQSTLWK